MVRTIPELVSRMRGSNARRLFRFGAVSAFNVLFGQAILLGSQLGLGLSPLAANTVSVCLGTVPAYILSRYWVWEKRGKNHLMREVVPFWTLTLIGFALSTFAVWYVDHHFHATPLVVNITNLTAFGVGWLAKFFILDRVLFRPEELAAA